MSLFAKTGFLGMVCHFQIICNPEYHRIISLVFLRQMMIMHLLPFSQSSYDEILITYVKIYWKKTFNKIK